MGRFGVVIMTGVGVVVMSPGLGVVVGWFRRVVVTGVGILIIAHLAPPTTADLHILAY